MTWRHYVVADVFTDVALQGNPVAVFTDGVGLDTETMQRAARELNLSETVFLVDGETDGADVRARIFTPATELPFAGHPVLGTAFVVGQGSTADTVRVATGAGIVPVRLSRDSETIVFGEMEQPIPTWEPLADAGPVLAALGVSGSACCRSTCTTTGPATCSWCSTPRPRSPRSCPTWWRSPGPPRSE